MEISELNRMIQRLQGEIAHVKKQVGTALRAVWLRGLSQARVGGRLCVGVCREWECVSMCVRENKREENLRNSKLAYVDPKHLECNII